MDTTMKRRRHSPEQIIRKLAEGDKLLAEGQSIDEVGLLYEDQVQPRRRRDKAIPHRLSGGGLFRRSLLSRLHLLHET
jgi:hypothetical protein